MDKNPININELDGKKKLFFEQKKTGKILLFNCTFIKNQSSPFKSIYHTLDSFWDLLETEI